MPKIAVIGIIGESVFLTVDKHQAVGETAHASSIHRELGGKGYNQAVAAARFGAEVSFLTAISRDDELAVRKVADEDGIKLTLATGDTPSPYGVIVTDSTGDNRVTVYGGAQLTVDDVEKYRESIKEADVLLINNEVPEAVNIRACEIARESDTRILLNPAPLRPISEYLLDSVDLFTPNEHECEALVGMKNVIVTIGKDGSKTLWDDRVHPTVRIDRVVDTTGAGDTYSGVLAALIGERVESGELGAGDSLSTLDMTNIIRVANAAASLEVTRQFVLPAIPNRREVMDLLNKQ